MGEKAKADKKAEQVGVLEAGSNQMFRCHVHETAWELHHCPTDQMLSIMPGEWPEGWMHGRGCEDRRSLECNLTSQDMPSQNWYRLVLLRTGTSILVLLNWYVHLPWQPGSLFSKPPINLCISLRHFHTFSGFGHPKQLSERGSWQGLGSLEVRSKMPKWSWTRLCLTCMRLSRPVTPSQRRSLLSLNHWHVEADFCMILWDQQQLRALKWNIVSSWCSCPPRLPWHLVRYFPGYYRD